MAPQDANPYAAPTAVMDDLGERGMAAPPLYNPIAAANWSLMFTPIFGAYLHWKNWQALGEERGAGWFIACILLQPFGLLTLMLWYFAAGRPQIKLVQQRYGDNYPRQNITKAVLVALGIYVGLLVVSLSLVFLLAASTRGQ